MTKVGYDDLVQYQQLDPALVKSYLADVGVAPPLLFFRAPDGEEGEGQPGDRFFQGSGEVPAPRDKGCCGQRCIWRFRIEGTIQQDTASLKLP